MTAIMGVDIAKEQADICLLIDGTSIQYQTILNDKRGLNKLDRWLTKQRAQGAHVCLEATGIYDDLLADTLHRRGYRISVVNSARTKGYAQSQLRRNKTDKLDAALIADFCRTQAPDIWTPTDPERQAMRALVRHLDDLKQVYQRVKNRIEAQRSSPHVLKQLKQQKRFFEGQMAQTEQRIREHVKRSTDLKRQRDLLTTLYMPAVVAKNHNAILKAFAARLEARGLAPKQCAHRRLRF